MKFSRTPLTRGVAAVALGAVVALGLWAVAAPASADVPSEPAAEFTAPLCEGTTLDDPTNAAGVVQNLASVFGTRLVEYNAGNIVPLYDVFGANELNGYPAVCGTRYVEGVGAVSEWMFCTDYFSHVCSGVNQNGDLLDIDGNAIPGVEALDDPNPKLTADQEKLIAYLIQHGQETYAGTGYFSLNDASSAVADETSWERAALQVLVWCISDPVGPTPAGAEIDRAATCETNMSAARQAEILAGLPDDPSLIVAGPVEPLEVGQTAEFSVTTDIFTSSLAVSTQGVAGTLSVISGPGILSGSDLQVAGSGEPVTVVLGLTATAAGTADLAVQATPAATTHIGWNQSPAVAADGKPCQVFATFHAADQVVLDGVASATFVAVGTDGDVDAGAGAGGNAGTGGNADAGGNAGAGGAGGSAAGADANGAGSGAGGAGTARGGLASTGSEPISPVVLIAAFAAVVGGAVLTLRSRRRQAPTVEA